MRKVIILLAEGFEEVEAITPIDILRRAGVDVVIASVENDKKVTSKNRIYITADVLLSSIPSFDDYTMLVIPGGALGVDRLMAKAEVLSLVRNFHERNLPIGAICAAPLVLMKAGVFEAAKKPSITSHPAAKEKLLKHKVNYLEDSVVIDDHLITSRGPGTALEFGLKLLEVIGGEKLAKRVQTEMVAN